MKSTELRSGKGMTSTASPARRAAILAAVMGALGSAGIVKATDLFYDADKDTSTAVGGTGNWTGDTTWRPGSSTGTPLQAWADGNDAHLPGTGTITLTGPVSANSLQFDSGSATVAGAQTLTLGAGGITVLGVGTHTVNSNIIAAGGLNFIRTQPTATTFTRLTLSGTNNFGGAINWNSTTAIGTGAMHRIEVTTASAIPSNTVLNFQTTQSQFQIGTTLASTDITLNGAIHLNALNTGTTLNQYLGSNGTAALQNRLIINGAVDGQAHLNFLAQNGGGGGEFLLNSAMTYTGDTLFNTVSSTGHARWGGDNRLPTTTNLTVGATTGTFGTGALDLKGFNQTVNSLKTGSSVTGAASAGITNTGANLSTITVTGLAGGPINATYASTIGTPLVTVSNISGPNLDNIKLVLASTHTGSLTLTNTSFYQGGTDVNGGGLIVNNNPINGSATGSGPVVVTNGASIGGSGRIAGAVSLSGAGTAFNPGGVGTVEDIQLDGGLTLGTGNVLNYDFSPSLNDKIVITGDLNLPATANTVAFNLNDLGGLVNGTYQLATYSGNLIGSFSSLKIGTAPPPLTNYTLVNNAGSIDLVVAGAANVRTWTGTGAPNNSLWDHNGSTNWTGAGNKFINGDQVVFDDSGQHPAITVAAAGVQPGQMTFSNNGVAYTFTGGSIGGSGSLTKTGSGTVTLNNSNTFTGGVNLGGGTLIIGSGNAIGGASAINFANNAVLQAGATLSTNRPISVGTGGGTIDTAGNDITATGAVSGAGVLTKQGAGTLTLGTSSPSFTGGTAINGGVLRVNSVGGAENVTGAGVGLINVNNGGTLFIDGVNMGTSTASSAASVTMNTGSTLLASGTSSYGKSGGFQVAVGAGVVNVNTVNASDVFTFKNSLRRTPSGAGDTNATIKIGGPGRVIIESGPVSAATTYSGSWDVSSGTLQLGPVDPLGFGEALNGPGFKDSDPKVGNTILVSGGTLAGAVNTPNPASSGAPVTPNFFRAAVVMGGGKLASVGLDSNWGGDFSTQAATTSQVLVYDPVGAAVARNVNLVAGAAQFNGDPTQISNVANTNWGGTLVVTPGALAVGGALNITRDGGVVTVTPGAVIQINQGATVNLGGTLDALQDTNTAANRVSVLNNSTTSFNVTSGTKNVGAIDGTGNTTVNAGVVLNADHVRQNTLTSNGRTNIRASSLAGGTSKVTSLVLGAAGKLDLSNNKLVTANAPGSATAGTYNGVQGLVQSGLNGGTWDGARGIITSQPTAVTPGPYLSTLGVATGAQSRGLGPTDTDLWGGQTINGASTLVMWTYAGDANLDGTINADDYALIAFNDNIASATGYYNGDFNYDGDINPDDYSLIDFNLNAQGAAIFNSGPADGNLSVAAVPEPTACGLIGATALLLGRRRRRA